jgi:hypothetical protein
MVAFVEHQRPRAQRRRPVDQRLAVRVQQLQQGLLIAAAQDRPSKVPIGFVVDDRQD